MAEQAEQKSLFSHRFALTETIFDDETIPFID
ncbi:hypothetical protein Mucpa_2610 [Mucilaginibacter paludis DSM 18603]|uniref:Uncharacterized protein n=1 Tax=Mucilaginibacter paludis DSM 18603 TaxID=714943 RepID=H1Y268_9SPHI|nr:hypothetical protein Mucpa_2610 [Mucilaginibacter paludis DSM 18603]